MLSGIEQQAGGGALDSVSELSRGLQTELVRLGDGEGQRMSAVRVLVADDDLTSRNLLRRVLERWGYDVVVAEDGAEAWERFQEDDPPLAILDWMMPGLDGVELCRRVRRTRPSPPYVILLTSRDGKGDIVTGLDAGADDYLGKPFDGEELRARLEVGRRFAELNAKLLDAQRILEVQAMTDPLTGILNRRAILERLEQEMARAKREGMAVGVGLVDVDHFKGVNDTLGHAAGDEVLCRARGQVDGRDQAVRRLRQDRRGGVPCRPARLRSARSSRARLERIRACAFVEAPVEVEGRDVPCHREYRCRHVQRPVGRWADALGGRRPLSGEDTGTGPGRPRCARRVTDGRFGLPAPLCEGLPIGRWYRAIIETMLPRRCPRTDMPVPDLRTVPGGWTQARDVPSTTPDRAYGGERKSSLAHEGACRPRRRRRHRDSRRPARSPPARPPSPARDGRDGGRSSPRRRRPRPACGPRQISLAVKPAGSRSRPGARGAGGRSRRRAIEVYAARGCRTPPAGVLMSVELRRR